jgi:hypothetical protein
MSDGSLDEPITAGVRHRWTDSSPVRGDPTVLTPVHTKRLKVYATRVAGDLGVSEEVLHEFIDVSFPLMLVQLSDTVVCLQTGGIYYMLIGIKATLLRWNDDAKKEELALLKELLDSKDFKVIYCSCLNVWRHKLIK